MSDNMNYLKDITDPDIVRKLEEITPDRFPLKVQELDEIKYIYYLTLSQINGPFFINFYENGFDWYFEFSQKNEILVRSKMFDTKRECLGGMELARKLVMSRVLISKNYDISDEILNDLLNFLCSIPGEKLPKQEPPKGVEEIKDNSEITKLLEERQHTHGDFSENSRFSQSLKEFAKTFKNYKSLTLIQKESIDMIFCKIGRILSGNVDHEDSWKDISGYAELGLKNIKYRKGRFGHKDV